MSSDQLHVYATASMTISYLCQGETFATITAPDLTTASGDSGVLAGGTDPIVANATYTIGLQDGTYQGLGRYYYDGSDVGFGQGFFQNKTDTKVVSPFVQLVRTYWGGNIHPVASGAATFTVVGRTSKGCAGSVTMESGMTYPTGALVYWTDNGTHSEDIVHSFTGGTSFNYTFPAYTAISNTVTGVVGGHAAITVYPGSCMVAGPDPGSGNSASSNTNIAAN